MGARFWTLAGLFWATSLLGSSAAQKPPAFTDPQQAGPDYKAQGEYAGEVPRGERTVKIGVQVIALGDGQFEGVLYPGGLPGDGWNKNAPRRIAGRRDGDRVRFAGDERSATIEGGKLTILDSAGNQQAQLEQVQRKSPTLGAKPPEGAVVLFDGTTAEHFQNGQLSPEGLLLPGVTSKAKFQDQRVHLEFQTPFMPTARGQARGNSGCYLQGRYEVQILDSFGLEGKDNECGGIYEIRDPDVNMCYPPLAWQTYDIDYTAARYDGQGNKTSNARITVRHNGVLIHDSVELPRSTRASPVKEGPEPGPLYLQDHGNPVRFRNIWVVQMQ